MLFARLSFLLQRKVLVMGSFSPKSYNVERFDTKEKVLDELNVVENKLKELVNKRRYYCFVYLRALASNNTLSDLAA